MSGLNFADPNYGIPAWLDNLVGGMVFSEALLLGWWFRPTRAPIAFKTCFSWVMHGKVKGEGRQSLTHVCCVALDDNALRQFWKIEDHYLQKPILSPEEKAIIEHLEIFFFRDKEGNSSSSFCGNEVLLRWVTLGLKRFTGLRHWRDLCRKRVLLRMLMKLCGSTSGWVMQSRYPWRKWAAHAWSCFTFSFTRSTRKTVPPASCV